MHVADNDCDCVGSFRLIAQHTKRMVIIAISISTVRNTMTTTNIIYSHQHQYENAQQSSPSSPHITVTIINVILSHRTCHQPAGGASVGIVTVIAATIHISALIGHIIITITKIKTKVIVIVAVTQSTGMTIGVRKSLRRSFRIMLQRQSRQG